MSSVADNLARVRERVAKACASAGRPESSVTLVAVSKLKPSALIREAYAAGQRDFGENYAQELRDKAEELKDLDGLRWHAIGSLQTNKVKYVARVAHAFHALERLDVATELSKRRAGTPPLPCYVELNLGGEDTKHGLTPDALGGFLSQVRELPNLQVVGLMALPPPTDDVTRMREGFARLRELAATHALTALSMGTTHDFEQAILEGATAVRVGTAIFGERA
ncbi:YggS family pyridoxal phosphate-dependent enzyme [Corallococcus exiguus]|uniref:YggS family pyridoxal phosphate-dependent enzyme n=1 Tax=Corallococcus TaxID=83461 RepID=UPI000EE4C727|nr:MULTISPECIES: YggS family pyridoxal phosphate-dependent enzyme [Corallococcus]NNB88878.1 YggS family pyridoxal phosphate-dependent enzyme [Corallococcus exiguus]NNC04370.1 YggS family pyridoxal phosphate-dependent enzyme [Corallococcus exiguus]NPC51490.1 YggS family pyridoxal phosphate-dependent enzyme [Corallococcus exiguus]RKH83764.1 YggS family pyridoxal phosphate-dependent enzyme [Corallococcus sp. AB032C]